LLTFAGCESPADKAEWLVEQIVATPSDWARPEHKRTVAEAKDELLQLGPAALLAMINGLGNDNRFVGMWLLEPIVAAGDSAVEPLAAALMDENANRRQWALLAITGLATKGVDISAAIPAILQCTGDADAEIRALSLPAISCAQHDRGVTQLISSLNDPDEHVQSEAAKYLGVIATIRAPGALIKEDTHPPVTHDVLADIKPILLSALSDESAIVRCEVANALGEFGPSVESAVRQAMMDSDAHVRAAALRSLACIRTDGAVEDLIDSLDDRAAPVRFQAATWLGVLADPDTLVLSRLRPPPLPEIQPQAISSAIPTLDAAANDNDPGVRKAATNALKAIRRSPTKGK